MSASILFRRKLDFQTLWSIFDRPARKLGIGPAAKGYLGDDFSIVRIESSHVEVFNASLNTSIPFLSATTEIRTTLLSFRPSRSDRAKPAATKRSRISPACIIFAHSGKRLQVYSLCLDRAYASPAISAASDRKCIYWENSGQVRFRKKRTKKQLNVLI